MADDLPYSDRALEKLIGFFKVLFKVIGRQVSAIAEIAAAIPQSMHMIRKHLNFDRDAFVKFAVCPKCTKLYDVNELFHETNGIFNARRCSNSWVQSKGRHIKCNGKLVKTVRLSGGAKKYYPLKIYCFQSIIERLESMIQQEGFLNACEEWKGRKIPSEYLADIYDGSMWKQFQKINDQPFLTDRYTFGFMLNCDWFNHMCVELFPLALFI